MDVVELQERVCKALPAPKKHFVLYRTEKEFLRALESDNQFMYGIFDKDKLIAQSILSFDKEFIDELPQYNFDLRDVAIYKGVLVDPDYRGGIMSRMQGAREDMAIMCGKKIALCKISVDNDVSMGNAKKHGMVLLQTARDGSGYVKTYWGKALEDNMLVMSMKSQMMMANFARREYLLNNI